jgi:hypothetical protein
MDDSANRIAVDCTTARNEEKSERAKANRYPISSPTHSHSHTRSKKPIKLPVAIPHRLTYNDSMVAPLLLIMRAWMHKPMRSRRGGQAMVEYVIVLISLFAALTTLGVLMYALRQQSNRVLDLVASDYP